MSHISLVKLAIVKPNMQLLSKAVHALAEELHGEVVHEVSDYYGNKSKVLIGLKTSKFHRGVGVEVEGNEVKLKGDFFGIPQSEVDKLNALLTKHYTHLATVSALQSMGYKVQSQKIRDKIHIRALAW